MQTIYCFVEEQSEELNEFINLHDSDSVIHIYSSIVESCEGSLYFCLGELVNEYIHTEGKIWLVTDVKSLFDIAKKLCTSLFEQIIYVCVGEQLNGYVGEEFSSAKKDFNEGLEATELIEYEIMIQTDKNNSVYMKKILDLKNSTDYNLVLGFFAKLENTNIESDERLKAIWIHYCKLLLYEVDVKDISENIFAYKLLVYSILMILTKDVSYTNAYLNEVLNNESVTAEEKYFLWNQFKGFSLKDMVVMDNKTGKALKRLYIEAYDYFKSELVNTSKKIPKEERNKDVVLVSTIQFLDYSHAPTKTVIERCKVLKKLGKEVILVNTTEQYLMVGYVPLYNVRYGIVCDDYNDVRKVGVGEESIFFMQIPKMATMSYRYKIMEEVINKFKPYYILSIGTGSMLADLCGNIVPCASMALAFSTLPHTMNKMQILGRRLSGEEINQYSMYDTDIIESRFTFELSPQTKTFTRKEMNLPDDRFILVVVGIRLQFEITSDFMDMLTKVCEQGCYVVFAGKFENYDDLMKEYETVADNSLFIGYCDEILALMEICDLYVNPARLGGGFSIIEAFEKGKPGVYLKNGDVYTAGGEDFAVDDYAYMVEEILKYKQDKKYYEQKSKMAKERAKLMTSSLEAIADIDNKIRQRIEERYW